MSKVLYPVCVGDGGYGYIDSNGLMKIEPAFRFADSFREGLARVYLDVNYGGSVTCENPAFIDEHGEVVIPAKSPNGVAIDEGMEGNWEFGEFSEGLATFFYDRLGNEGAWGYIDRTGKLKIEPQFVSAFNLREGLAKVALREGDETKSAFLRIDGSYAIPPREWFGGGDFAEGLCAVEMKVNETRVNPFTGLVEQLSKTGFIDRSGSIRIPLRYDKANDFSDGLAVCMTEADGKLTYHYVKKDGTHLFDNGFEFATNFSRGVAYVVQHGEGRIIDRTGTVLSTVAFDATAAFVGNFSDGLAWVEFEMQNGEMKYGFMDLQGTMAIEAEYASAMDFESGLALVSTIGGVTGYINRKGEFVWQTSEWKS